MRVSSPCFVGSCVFIFRKTRRCGYFSKNPKKRFDEIFNLDLFLDISSVSVIWCVWSGVANEFVNGNDTVVIVSIICISQSGSVSHIVAKMLAVLTTSSSRGEYFVMIVSVQG